MNGIPGRVEHLFGAIKNPTTGEPHANAKVARMCAGTITEEGVEGIRTGRIADPTVGQVAALAAAFGVSSAYLLDRGKELPVLDEEALGALADEPRVPYSGRARLSQRKKGVELHPPCPNAKRTHTRISSAVISTVKTVV